MEHGFASTEVRKIDKAISYVVSHTYVKTLVFIAAFLEGIISPLPPEVLVAAIFAYRKDLSWKALSLVSAFGSALGLSSLYFLGRYAYATHAALFGKYISLHAGAVAENVVSGNTVMGAFFSTFTPLVDRIFTVSAGVFGASYALVVIGLFFGRLLRVGIVAYFSHRFGPEARSYIIRHTKIALLIGTVLIVYVIGKALGIL